MTRAVSAGVQSQSALIRQAAQDPWERQDWESGVQGSRRAVEVGTEQLLCIPDQPWLWTASCRGLCP